AHGGQRIGRLAALRDDEHHIAIPKNGIAIAKFAGVLDLYGNARKLLDEVFPDQTCMPRRAARADDDTLRLLQLLENIHQPSELDRVLLQSDAAANAVFEGLRLLHDPFEHEVLEPALLDLLEVPLELVNLLLERRVVDGFHLVPGTPHDHHLPVIQVHDLARMLDEWRSVGSHEILVIPHSEDERAALARGDQKIVILPTNNC